MELKEVEYFLGRFFSDLKRSIEGPFGPSISFRGEKDEHTYKNILLYLEEIRIDFNIARRKRDGLSRKDIEKISGKIYSLKSELVSSKRFFERPFRASSVNQERDLFRLDYSVLKINQPDIPQAIDFALKILNDNSIDDAIKNISSINPDSVVLRRTIPRQKIAPVMFDIARSRIVVTYRQSKTTSEDVDNINLARDALVQRGGIILDSLKKTNCDQRIIDSIKELQSVLAETNNIIRLGLINISAGNICRAASHELPDAIIGAIEGHISGVNMYISQFEDWRRFAEQSAAAALDAIDIEKLKDTSSAILDYISNQPDLADPKVPRTFAALRELIFDPLSATKRAAFAMLRTIENLVARLYQFGADVAEKTLSKSAEYLSTTMSRIVVVSLLGLSVVAGQNLADLSSKIPELNWVKTATEIVKRQLEAQSK